MSYVSDAEKMRTWGMGGGGGGGGVQEILAILPQKHLLALGRILSISTPKSKHVLWTKVFLSLVETTLSKMIKIKGKGDLGMSWESYLRLTLAILRR